MKTFKIFSAVLCAGLVLTSCDKFLDKNPDNRASLDTPEKVVKILGSAYMANGYPFICEIMSDNCDEYNDNNPYTGRFLEQVWYWKDVTESNNESPERFWSSAYMAIANANAAIDAVENLGGPTTTTLSQALGEALMSRAFHHFMLVNVFAKNYNKNTSSTDPGITYMVESEHTLSPQYERNSVAEIYELIEKDIEAALPLMGDDNLTVPAYHFSRRAAYAFAAKFYLFYEKWDKAIECANECLGSAPETLLRDYVEPASSFEAVGRHYIDASQKCNLLLFTAYSQMGPTFGAYYTNSKYTHGAYLATNETSNRSRYLWGSAGWVSRVRRYSGTNLDKTLFFRLPYLFEYTDPVAGIGYTRTVYPSLTTDETLLIRAEAEIMKDQYDAAVEDLNIWLHNISSTTYTLTKDNIIAYEKSLSYATWNASTPKKHLNPAFEIGAEGSDKECLIQFLLDCRRIETLQIGLRWFDIKRYGIEIWRRQMNASGTPQTLKDVLTKDDPRRAVQIPQKVIDAGYDPNPRGAQTSKAETVSLEGTELTD